MVINLVGNAVKFTAGGEVVVSLAAEPPAEGRVTLHLAVRDTGIGIPAEKHEEIFGAFSQVDSSISSRYGGTGLGLAITARIARLMGGEIALESAPGRGSTFRVSVPFRMVEGSPPPAAAGTLLAGRRALVVDDNESSRQILQANLRVWGIESEAAATGPEALARILARAGERPFDLVLLDAGMPGSDSFALAEEIRLVGGGGVIMLLSVVGAHAGGARCRRPGIAAHLTKPVSRSELLETVQRVLGLRADSPPPRQRPLDDQPARREPVSSLSILLAENNPVSRLVARRLLERAGHQVSLAGNGEEAVERCRERSFDLIFLDVQMPGMNGFEATARIRALASGPSRVIVAMTAHASGEDRKRCLAAGMDDYISKPVDSGILAATLRRHAGATHQGMPS
jgi:CheY-like chemotaxis protein